MRDVIIVGSGPAGVSAALQLAGSDVLMLDVGLLPIPVPKAFCGDLYKLRMSQTDLFPSLIGQEFESLVNLFEERKTNLKLKSPYMNYIIQKWRTLAPITSDSFEGVISLAKGGLANAWGAGVYRFSDADMGGFPINYRDLNPYYDALTRHIGVSRRQ